MHDAARPAPVQSPVSCREAEARLRFGFQRQQAGDLAMAATCYREALAANPHEHRALTLLGAVLEAEGDADGAAALYARAIAAAPAAPAPRLQLATLRLKGGDARQAYSLIGPFTDARPKDANGWRLRAAAADALGDKAEAMRCFAAALEAGDIKAAAPLGKLRQDACDWAGAAAAYERALPVDPTNARLHGALGKVYAKLGRTREAILRYAHAIHLDPTLGRLHAAFGLELHGVGRYEEAAKAYGYALSVDDGDVDEADILNNLANVRLAQGRPRLAQAIYRELLDRHPYYVVGRRNLCLAAAYDDAVTTEELAAVCRDAVQDFPVCRGRPRLRDTTGRPLRVGFVSGDFRAHSVAAFVEPLFAHFDPARIACHAYSVVSRPDRITARLKRLATAWRDVHGWSADQLADAVRADEIDILIELAGPTGDVFLDAFAARPAPVQASWLGWPATSGSAAIDFKLSDALLTPPGGPETFFETPLNLEGPALCFQPPDDAPETAPAPILANGYPTFGSFNRVFKASPRTLRLWAAVLNRVRGGRLLLKDAAFRCPETSQRFLGRLEAAGIAPSRVRLVGSTATRADHLALYGEVDIALDSVPYNGVTTTCEALWMGVPTVSVVGDRSLARYGLTVLSHAGLRDCVATDGAGYVDRAVALAGDPAALADMRRGMRERLLASPLLDGPAYARNFAAACRRMLEIVAEREAS